VRLDADDLDCGSAAADLHAGVAADLHAGPTSTPASLPPTTPRPVFSEDDAVTTDEELAAASLGITAEQFREQQVLVVELRERLAEHFDPSVIAGHTVTGGPDLLGEVIFVGDLPEHVAVLDDLPIEVSGGARLSLDAQTEARNAVIVNLIDDPGGLLRVEADPYGMEVLLEGPVELSKGELEERIRASHPSLLPAEVRVDIEIL